MYKTFINKLKKRALLTAGLSLMGMALFAQEWAGGTRTIGATGNYPTLKAAIAALTSAGGLTDASDGDVILELQADYDPAAEFTVAGSITIGAITNASAGNQVVIRPAAGVTKTITAGIDGYGTIQFELAKYITIDGRQGGTGNIGLTIINTSTSNGTSSTAAIKFIGGSDYNTITYCNLRASAKNTTYGGVVYFGNGAGGNNNNTISYNDITSVDNDNKVTNGIANYNSTNPSTNNTIKGNNIYNFSLSAVLLNLTGTGTGWEITNNKIYGSVATGTLYGISVETAAAITVNITGNKIYGISSSGGVVYPVRIAGNGNTNRIINVVNNVIALNDAYTGTAGSNSIIGVTVTGAGTVNLYYTTIHLSNAVKPLSAYACYGWTSGAIINIRNCIFSANVTDLNTLVTGVAGITINRTYSLFAYRATGGTQYTTDGNRTFYYGESMFVPAIPDDFFTNRLIGDLSIKSDFRSLIDITGTPIVGYTTDINNIARNGITPSKGAYDYSEQTLPVTISSFTAKLNNNKVQFNWAVGTETNVNRYEVERLQVNGAYVKVATVSAIGSSSYAATDNQPLLGTNYYRLKAVDNDGAVGYFADIRDVKVTTLGDKSVSIYPNPVTGTEINIALTNYPAGQYSYKIVSVAGNVVQQGQLANNGSNKIVLSATLAKGIYILHVANGEERVQTKLIKN